MNYDTLKSNIAKIDNVIEKLELQKPISNEIDKCGLRFSALEHENNYPKLYRGAGDWSQARVTFGAQHGYWGNSSAYDDLSPLLAHYVIKALDALEYQIINKAKELANSDKVKFAAKAKEEAQKILEIK